MFNQYRVVADDGLGGRTYAENLPPIFPGKLLLERTYFRHWGFSSPVWGTVMARRDAYIAAGLFDPRFSFVSDVDMWMRLAEVYEVAYIAEPLISLPGRGMEPRQWSINERPLCHQMFWEARMRHYKDRPLRRTLEAFRHFGFVVADNAYRTACQTKANIRRIVSRYRPGFHALGQ